MGIHGASSRVQKNFFAPQAGRSRRRDHGGGPYGRKGGVMCNVRCGVIAVLLLNCVPAAGYAQTREDAGDWKSFRRTGWGSALAVST